MTEPVITFATITAMEERLLRMAAQMPDDDGDFLRQVVAVLTRLNIALSAMRRVVERV